VKEKTIKDIIEKSHRYWHKKGDNSQDDNCYKGWFWDYTTKKLVRWHELTGENTHNEEEDTSITGC